MHQNKSGGVQIAARTNTKKQSIGRNEALFFINRALLAPLIQRELR
jgi:hypothetical protein